jgi:hypothetical protein
MHKPYEERLRHPADFRIKHRFFTKNEGGRNYLPYQGIRSDFWYEGLENESGIYMIWPEFENANGEVILEDNIAVPESGTARMWIIASGYRLFHQARIKVGAKGFFKEGMRSTAECEVIEILGLLTNPTK